MAFFQDHIDDIARGDTTAETLPEDLRKTLAVLISDYNNPEIITKGSALAEQHPDGIEEMSAEGLKEKFMIQPKTEDRPMTDEELDSLLEGFDENSKPNGPMKMIIKDGKRIFVPDESKKYVQNEEQSPTTKWEPVKELDIPEPEQNEIQLPTLTNTEEENIVDIAESINIETSINQDKFTNHKKRLTSDEEYHQRVEQRINDLITKLENDEIKLKDLTPQDQQVIMDILNQNG